MSPSHPPLIGLLGLYRCGNLGDEAIWRAFAQALPPLLPAGSRLLMITYGPGGYECACLPADPAAIDDLLHRLALDDPRARRLRFGYWLTHTRRFLHLLRGCDAVWYAGGHWIHDLSLSTLAGVMLPLLAGRLRRFNAGFVNVGAGPLDSALGRRLARLAVGPRGPLLLRDEHSVDVVRSAGIRRPAQQAADAAFLLDPLPDNETSSFWSRLGLPGDRPVIGLVPCAWFRMADLYSPQAEQVERMIRELAALLREWAAQGFAVALIPTMLPEDEQVCAKIIALAGDGPYRLAPTRELPARALVGIIGRLRALVTFRMHPALFAYRMGTPVVALDYAPKLRSLMTDLGLARWLVSLDEDWPARLRGKLAQLFDDDAPLAGATPLEQMREKALLGMQKAVETLEK